MNATMPSSPEASPKLRPENSNPLFIVLPDGSIKPTRRGRRAAMSLSRRAARRDYRKTVREARKLGIRGANGLSADYAGGVKRPQRHEA